MNEQDILFEVIQGNEGNIGIITLNRPQTLNALTKQMCISINHKLTEWEQSSAIKAVAIRGEGDRGFCAGGDIRYLYEKGKESMLAAREFFWNEYRLNHHIYHFTKPYIAFLHGVTMGGGLGISVHGSHRVASEDLKLAMPETAIGFFPDVGGSYFLSRCPGKLGLYLGLTGAQINTADAYYIGAIQHQISKEQFPTVLAELADTSFTKNAHNTVTRILEHYSVKPAQPTLSLYRAMIDSCFAKNSIEEILQALREYPDSWCQNVANDLLKKSPMSLKIVFEQINKAQNLSFDECLKMEYKMTAGFLKSHDFYEGVRAAIIDKDRTPRWRWQDLATISAKDVEDYFLGYEDSELNFEN